MTGTYSAVTYDSNTRELLYDWCRKNGIPNLVSIESLHTTIIYSKNKIDKSNEIHIGAADLKLLNWEIRGIGFDVFKSGEDDVLVLLLKADDLEALHDRFIAHGATHDFENYVPHVTLSYSLTSDFDLGKLYPPSFNLVPATVYTEDLDLEWLG